jgi:flagellar biosynthesis protein
MSEVTVEQNASDSDSSGGRKPPRRSASRHREASSADGKPRGPNSALDGGRRHAVALTYDATRMQAPTVSAVGHGLIADRIVEVATQNDVPVRQDGDLAALLAPLQVGQVVPPELYPLVAEVLAFVYRLKRRTVTG